MKTAEEWASENQGICYSGNEATCDCGDGNTCEELARIIRAVQRDAIEAAIALAKSHATCGCGGKFGRCTEDGPPLAIANDLLSLLPPTP